MAGTQLWLKPFNRVCIWRFEAGLAEFNADVYEKSGMFGGASERWYQMSLLGRAETNVAREMPDLEQSWIRPAMPLWSYSNVSHHGRSGGCRASDRWQGFASNRAFPPARSMNNTMYRPALSQAVAQNAQSPNYAARIALLWADFELSHWMIVIGPFI